MSAHSNPEPSLGDDLLTIDELSRRVGMTVRNLREWRTLGLLPAAEIRGRVGYYDAAVVERIKGVQNLHSEGFPLDLIRRLLDASGESGDEVMRFARALRAPFRDDRPPIVDLDEWAELWGAINDEDLRYALDVGLIRERDDDQLEYTSSRVAEVGRALHALGLTLHQTLDATAEIRAHADGVAELFERVWLEHIWQPYLDVGMPESELPKLRQTLATVQPLAMDAVVALFTVAMESRIEQSITREVERAARKHAAGRAPRSRRRSSRSAEAP
jgi:DNA-binding transcriptional MerR regulator